MTRTLLCIYATGMALFAGAADAQDPPTGAATPLAVHEAAARLDTTQAEVLRAVDRLFDAMRLRDTSAARTLMLPGAIVLGASADGERARHRLQPGEDWVDGLAVGTELLLERLWAPQVLIDGPMAHVWARYDFHVDGAFSHCGTDSFGLVQTREGWRFSLIAFTVQTMDCPESPLGPTE